MKRIQVLLAMLVVGIAASSVHADDDCHDPIDQWRSRDELRQLLEPLGWDIHQIRVHDHCYDVKAMDENGSRIYARFLPASLNLKEINIHFSVQAEVKEQWLGIQELHEHRSSISNESKPKEHDDE